VRLSKSDLRQLPAGLAEPWTLARRLAESVASAPARALSRRKRSRRRPLEISALRGAVAVFLALLHADVCAEWSGSVSALSNYRYRGVSLTDNDPAVQGTINYDDPSGL